MTIPFLDLWTQHESLEEDFLRQVKQLLRSSNFILGPTVQKFEDQMARYLQVKHAIGVASGTDALLLALASLGVGPGDEVVMPAYTFVACADVVVRLGGRPVFVDVKADTFNLDADKALASLSSRTKAIIAVHLFGQAAEIDRITTIARTYSVPVIEDACQSYGAKIHGKRVGSFGLFGAFSFYPTKNLGGIGDGGLLVTDDDQKAETLRKYRDHGRASTGGYFHDVIGYNSRLDAIQAAFLSCKQPDVEEMNLERIENARLYNQLFENTPIVAPKFKDDGSHVYNCYTIQVSNRNELQAHLKSKGIGTAVYYPCPLHLQPCLQYLGYKEGAFPISEELAKRALSLPISPGLKKKQISQVAQAVLEFYGIQIPEAPATHA
jgi:dTDP-4-amino-4,6-dideoxygalactose transaminase